MKPINIHVDLKESCRLYSESIRKAMMSLMAVDVNLSQDVEVTSELETIEDLHFSIFLTGSIYGELLIGMNRQTALEMLGIPKNSPDQLEQTYFHHREELIDNFKEVINIAAGHALKKLKTFYPDVTITPPRAIEGKLTLSKFEINKVKLSHPAGTLSCYIYIDFMKLDVASVLEVKIKEIETQKNKQQELIQLNRAKTEFLANMSHELRTPLNGMIGMLDVLKTSPLNSSQLDQVAIVSRSGEYLLSIISDILEFSKLEAGRLEIVPVQFNLPHFIESVTDFMSTEIYRKKLDFGVQIQSGVPLKIFADETRLRQILINLIGNSLKFTPTGSIHLYVNFEPQGKTLVIAVQDSGVGIPQSKIESIFESFTQADASDTRRYGGTGLGLSITKNIVQKMGGTISVNSIEAVGSTFTIRIPLELTDDYDRYLPIYTNALLASGNKILRDSIQSMLTQPLAAEIEEQKNSDLLFIDYDWYSSQSASSIAKLNQDLITRERPVLFLVRPSLMNGAQETARAANLENVKFVKLPASIRSIEQALRCEVKITESTPLNSEIVSKAKSRVLLVEDNEINLLVAETMLKSFGFKIDKALNGKEAVENYDLDKYDFILMDCQMPILDGFDATKAIREKEAGTSFHVPIIALTANAFRETKEKCFESGMDDFATKPIKRESLREVIDRAVKITLPTLSEKAS